MCGLIGALMFEGKLKVGEKQRREAIIMLVTELLQLTRIRGKDATGVTTLFNDGKYIGMKMGIESTDFIGRFGETETDYDGYLKLLRENEERMRIFLGHCRKSSVGNSWDNVNNHPIKVGEIVGIHNGTLTNHEKIFDNLKCKRDGEVDSEAIFRLLNHYTREGQDPFTPEIIQEVTQRMHGSYAVLTYNGNNPYQAAAFRDGRPIEMVLVKPLNTVLIASDKVFLQQALFRLSKGVHLYNTFPKALHVSDKNLDFKMLTDDSLAIFDLTAEVTENSKIEDLFYDEKIPRNDKIWGVSSSTTYSTGTKSTNSAHKTAWQRQQEKEKKDANDSTNYSSTTNKPDKTEVFAKSTGNKTEKKPGFVYNKGLGSYTDEEVDPEDENKGNVEITTTGKVSDLDTNNDTDDTIAVKNFSLVQKTKIEPLVSSIAKITEVKVKEKSKTVSLSSVKPIVSEVESKEAEVVEMDTVQDPEAMEEAESFTNGLNRFKTEEDLITGIELDGKTVLKSLKPHSLANRVATFATRFAFYHGFLAAKEKTSVHSEPEAVSNSLANIRRFKIMSIKLAEIIDQHPAGEAIKGRIVDRNIKELLNAPSTEITPVTLRKMYSAGDLRSSFTLKRVMSTVMSAKRKEDKSENGSKEKTNTGTIGEDGQ